MLLEIFPWGSDFNCSVIDCTLGASTNDHVAFTLDEFNGNNLICTKSEAENSH